MKEKESITEEKLTWKDIWVLLRAGFFLSLGWTLGDLFWAIIKAFADKV